MKLFVTKWRFMAQCPISRKRCFFVNIFVEGFIIFIEDNSTVGLRL